VSFDRFAVVRVPFPFTDREAAKNRPALGSHACSCFLDGSVSSEVDVVAEAAFAGPLEQPQQRRPFRSPCLASDDHDNPATTLRLRQLDEVVAVAGQQETLVFVSKCEAGRISFLQRQDIAQPEDFVIEFSERTGENLRLRLDPAGTSLLIVRVRHLACH
jgi:hypothetical protein